MNSFFASCPTYFEETLEQECHCFNLSNVERKKSGVEFNATPEQALNFILGTRISSRVSVKLGSFSISNEKGLYQGGLNVPWHEILSPDETLKVQTILGGHTRNSFSNSVYLSQLLKDAICDQLREKTSKRPNVELTDPDQTIIALIESDNNKGFSVTLSLDLCGRPLHERGYRTKFHDAPIKENLAAALILSTDWDPENEAFVNPMCGSGTFLVEAALIQAKLPPTIFKINQYLEFGISTWAFLNSKSCAKFLGGKLQIEQTLKSIQQNAPIAEVERLSGYDIDVKAFEATACALGKLPQMEDIRISKKDFFNATATTEKGVIMINPPYGHRLDADADFYYKMGEHLKQAYKNHRVYLLCPDPDLRKSIRLKTTQKIPFRNGKIECRLLKYELY